MVSFESSMKSLHLMVARSIVCPLAGPVATSPATTRAAAIRAAFAAFKSIHSCLEAFSGKVDTDLGFTRDQHSTSPKSATADTDLGSTRDRQSICPSQLQPTPISGLPEIGTQCRPSRLQPTWLPVVFRSKSDQLKKLQRVCDSTKSKRALVVLRHNARFWRLCCTPVRLDRPAHILEGAFDELTHEQARGIHRPRHDGTPLGKTLEPGLAVIRLIAHQHDQRMTSRLGLGESA